MFEKVKYTIYSMCIICVSLTDFPEPPSVLASMFYHLEPDNDFAIRCMGVWVYWCFFVCDECVVLFSNACTCVVMETTVLSWRQHVVYLRYSSSQL
jgi:hypothetical protein